MAQAMLVREEIGACIERAKMCLAVIEHDKQADRLKKPELYEGSM